MKTYRATHQMTSAEEIADYIASKIEHHYDQEIGKEETGAGEFKLSYRDGEAKIVRVPESKEVKVSGDGKILGWSKNMLNKPSSPVEQ